MTINPIKPLTEALINEMGHSVGLELVEKCCTIAYRLGDNPQDTTCRCLGIMLCSAVYGKVATDMNASESLLEGKDEGITDRIVEKVIQSAYNIMKSELYDNQPQPSKN